jgi:hypothetical protein
MTASERFILKNHNNELFKKKRKIFNAHAKDSKDFSKK